MTKEFDTEFLCNSIFWIRSLPDSELGPSRRMIEDVELSARVAVYDFNCVDVHNINDMKLLLGKLAQLATDNLNFKPILHLDMHGDEEKGLLIGSADQYLSWGILAEHLRLLNTAMMNNLCVVGAACFGLSAITPIALDKPTPFFMLIAPQEEVKVGFIEKNIPIAQYVQESCKGKPGQKRHEYLLTEVFLSEMGKTDKYLGRKRPSFQNKPNCFAWPSLLSRTTNCS